MAALVGGRELALGKGAEQAQRAALGQIQVGRDLGEGQRALAAAEQLQDGQRAEDASVGDLAGRPGPRRGFAYMNDVRIYVR